MAKTLVNTADLVEADFRQLQKLYYKKFNREYSVNLIRLVCKGKRSNSAILAMAQDYVKTLEENAAALQRLAS